MNDNNEDKPLTFWQVVIATAIATIATSVVFQLVLGLIKWMAR